MVDKSKNSYLITSVFDDQLVVDFHKFLDNRKGNNIIIYIDSSGGSISSLVSILGLLEVEKQLHITTVALGTCYSCALFLLQVGNKKYGTKFTEFIHHATQFEFKGDILNVLKEIKATKKEDNRLNNWFSSKTKKVGKWWIDQAKKARKNEFRFNSEEALKLGVIDYIGIPKKNTRG